MTANIISDSNLDLTIELMNGGQGDGLILPKPVKVGNIDRVAIHPIHLRYVVEKMGLL